jgi:hypothetical protein
MAVRPAGPNPAGRPRRPGRNQTGQPHEFSTSQTLRCVSLQFGHRSGNPSTLRGRRLDFAGCRASSPHQPDEERATGLRRCGTEVYGRDCRGDCRRTQAINPVPGGFLTTSVALCPPFGSPSGISSRGPCHPYPTVWRPSSAPFYAPSECHPPLSCAPCSKEVTPVLALTAAFGKRWRVTQT